MVQRRNWGMLAAGLVVAGTVWIILNPDQDSIDEPQSIAGQKLAGPATPSDVGVPPAPQMLVHASTTSPQQDMDKIRLDKIRKIPEDWEKSQKETYSRYMKEMGFKPLSKDRQEEERKAIEITRECYREVWANRTIKPRDPLEGRGSLALEEAVALQDNRERWLSVGEGRYWKWYGMALKGNGYSEDDYYNWKRETARLSRERPEYAQAWSLIQDELQACLDEKMHPGQNAVEFQKKAQIVELRQDDLENLELALMADKFLSALENNRIGLSKENQHSAEVLKSWKKLADFLWYHTNISARYRLCSLAHWPDQKRPVFDLDFLDNCKSQEGYSLLEIISPEQGDTLQSVCADLQRLLILRDKAVSIQMAACEIEEKIKPCPRQEYEERISNQMYAIYGAVCSGVPSP